MTKNPNKLYLWILLMVFVAILLVRNAWVGDDAFISFRVVDNFLNGYGLRWNVIERVQAYTHPLWLFLMIAASFFTGECYFTSIALSIVSTLAAIWVLFVHINKKSWSGFAAVTLLLCSKAFIDYTTSGLENALSYLLIGIFLAAYFANSVKPSLLTLIAALVILNRMDLFLLVLPPLIDVAWRIRSKRRELLMMLVGFAPFIIWEIFSLIYYGFPFPNTAYAKLSTGIPRVELIHQGILYLFDSIATDPLTLVVIIFACFSGFVSGERRSKILSLSLIMALGYIVWIGGDFMSGRFLAVPYFFAVCVLARQWAYWTVTASVAVMASVIAGTLFLPNNAIVSDADYKGGFHRNGIADERGYYYPEMGLLNVARHVPKKSVNHQWFNDALVEREKRIAEIDVVGIIGYAAGPKLFIIDVFALGDALMARLPILSGPTWRIGHFLRRVPKGYDESIKTGLNRFEDKNLGAYYQHIKKITQGNIFSGLRFKTIVAMNMGKYDELIDRNEYKFNPIIVQKNQMSIPKSSGTAWDEPGNIVFGSAVDVQLEGVSHARTMDISLDHNDGYAVRFCLQNTCVEQLIELQRVQGGGLSSAKIVIRSEARTQGFDHIFIYPVEGDGDYSLGHLILDE